MEIFTCSFNHDNFETETQLNLQQQLDVCSFALSWLFLVFNFLEVFWHPQLHKLCQPLLIIPTWEVVDEGPLLDRVTVFGDVSFFFIQLDSPVPAEIDWSGSKYPLPARISPSLTFRLGGVGPFKTRSEGTPLFCTIKCRTRQVYDLTLLTL